MIVIKLRYGWKKYILLYARYLQAIWNKARGEFLGAFLPFNHLAQVFPK